MLILRFARIEKDQKLPEDDTESAAFERGRYDWNMQKLEAENPFEPGTTDYDEWNRGYEEESRKGTDKDSDEIESDERI